MNLQSITLYVETNLRNQVKEEFMESLMTDFAIAKFLFLE